MLKNAVTLEYDTGRFPFAKVLAAQVFRVPDLGRLHESSLQGAGRRALTYDDNMLLRKRMQQMSDDALFYKLYHSWIAEVLAPQYGYVVAYSAHPKMRVHLSGTGTVSQFHRDVDITGRALQINCYLPFTDVSGSSTLWAESDYGLRDYQPLNLRYGQALLWDGGCLLHGTVHNETPFTRVSCDFRFQPKEPALVSPPWSEILSGRRLHPALLELLPSAAQESGDRAAGMS